MNETARGHLIALVAIARPFLEAGRAPTPDELTLLGTHFQAFGEAMTPQAPLPASDSIGTAQETPKAS